MAQHMRSVQPIPAKVQQLAEIHSLGAPTASYSKRTLTALLALIVWPIVYMLSCLEVFFEPGGLGLTLFVTIVGGGLIVSYVYFFPKRQVYMYTDGFVYLRWRKAEALRIEQIETIRYGTADTDSNIWISLRLRKTDGTELKVRIGAVLRDARGIYSTIEREFVRIRLPGMIEQYEAGHSIAFGELSVNKLGLTRKGETLPWSQVQSIDVGDQRVEIKKEGQKGRNWFVGIVPNQSLLRELVTHMRSSH
jgi:Family of unknown function (DUF6585)